MLEREFNAAEKEQLILLTRNAEDTFEWFSNSSSGVKLKTVWE
jgi:hypothetical protein